MMSNFAEVGSSIAGTSNPPSSLTQSIALEESPVPKLMNTTVALIGGIMLLFIIWAAFARVEEVAIATGQIVPSGYIQDIQHPDGGVVQEILVRESDLVEKGAPLIRLDATNANADLGQMEARRQALQLEATRLRTYTGSGKTSDHVLTAEEQAILDSMEEARENQRSVVRDQISQREKELTAISATRSALEKNVALKREENQLFQDSLERGSSSKLTALTSQRELNDLEGQLKEAMSQESRAKDAVQEAKSRLQSLDADLKQDAMKKLGTVEAELSEINKSIGRQESAATRTVLTAPVRGIIKGLTVHTLGAVVEAGKVIMEVVPVDEELLVEALVSPADIGNIKIGQPVRIKVSAFDFSRYGSIEGKIASISASTFQNEEGNFFYKTRVKLGKSYVGSNSNANMILPGMTVQADINIGTKTVLQYLLKPIQTVTQNAFSER
jgi:adhesin transport system membrane fusion protein